MSNFGKEEEAKSEVRDGDFRMIMEVLVGSSYGMEVSAPAASSHSPTYGRDQSGVPPTAAQEQGEAVVSSSSYSSSSSCPFLNGEEDVVGVCREKLENGYGSDGSSESSIGSPGDSDEEQENENENDEASPSKGDRQLFRSSNFSLDSLDDSLPIKRGLSNHYNGKSKSFGNLSEVSSVKDLEKAENPFNKRRRVLIASKLSKKFFYSRLNPKSMPLLPVIRDDDDKTDDDDDYDGGGGRAEASNTGHKLQKQQQQPQNQSGLKICSKSMSCFALGDLIEEEDEED